VFEHTIQLFAEVLPYVVDIVYLPATQRMHTLEVDAPVVEDHEPGEQGVTPELPVVMYFIEGRRERECV